METLLRIYKQTLFVLGTLKCLPRRLYIAVLFFFSLHLCKDSSSELLKSVS